MSLHMSLTRFQRSHLAHSRSSRAWLVHVAFAALAASHLGCEADAEPEDATGDDGAAQVRAEEIRWIAHTLEAGDAFGDEGFTGIYDLGIEFEVGSAWWVHYSAALIPCENEAAAGARSSLPGIRVARAGHDDIPDGSTLPESVATALSPGRSFELGSTAFVEEVYCGVHLLAARADEATLNLGEAPDLLGNTVSLEGRYRLSPADGWAEFSCATDAPVGTILPLKSAWVSADAPADQRVWDVTVTRMLATALNGIDPSTSTVDGCGRAVLANLFSDDAIDVWFEPTP